MTVCYPGAGSIAAIFLGASGNVIRLAVEGWDDVADFRLINGQWISEDHEPVEIDSNPQSWWTESLGAGPCLVQYHLSRQATSRWVN